MKLKLLFLISLLVFSCKEQTDTSTLVPSKINEVENNLIPPIYITGDSTWTVEERMQHYGVPGVSIAVIQEGEIAWSKSYGIIDKETKIPVSNTTLFQAASISKPVSAYGALTLVEQGKIDLTKDINSQLNSWKLPENEFTATKKVTPKNLLNHSAGVTVHGFLGYSPDLPVPSLIQVLNGESPANSQAAVVDKTPEESFRYSGGGYNIMQQLMIDVEGKPFPYIMEQQVLQPLGMTQSSFNQPLTTEQLTHAATGYLPNGSMTKGKRHTYPEMAPAGLWTTAEDLAKFATTIQKTLSGETEMVLSKDLTEQMLTPFVSDFMGLGMFIIQMKDQTYFGHGGWNEGFSSEMMAHKDKGYGVVVMTNSNHPAFISELIRAVAITYKWDDYVPIYTAIEPAAEELSKITGRYAYQGYNFVEVALVNNQLQLREGAEKEPTSFVKVSDSTYVVRSSDNLYQFKESNNNIELQVINSRTLETQSGFTKMSEETKLPIDFLLNDNYEAALQAYQSLYNEDSNNPAVNENTINSFGYRFLSTGKSTVAKNLFKINTILYPDSFNVYDSYAEACMELGEVELAISNYKKSLELNPKNDNAKHQIKKLEKMN